MGGGGAAGACYHRRRGGRNRTGGRRGGGTGTGIVRDGQYHGASIDQWARRFRHREDDVRAAAAAAAAAVGHFAPQVSEDTARGDHPVLGRRYLVVHGAAVVETIGSQFRRQHERDWYDIFHIQHRLRPDGIPRAIPPESGRGEAPDNRDSGHADPDRRAARGLQFVGRACSGSLLEWHTPHTGMGISAAMDAGGGTEAVPRSEREPVRERSDGDDIQLVPYARSSRGLHHGSSACIARVQTDDADGGTADVHPIDTVLFLRGRVPAGGGGETGGSTAKLQILRGGGRRNRIPAGGGERCAERTTSHVAGVDGESKFFRGGGGRIPTGGERGTECTASSVAEADATR